MNPLRSYLGWLNPKRHRQLAGASVLLGMGLLASLGMASRPGGNEPPPPPDTIAANGTVEGARRTVEIRPEVTGTLATLPVRVGQQVQAGELLFELRNDTQQAEVLVAEKDGAVAWARHRELEALCQRAQRARSGVSDEERDRAFFQREQAALQAERLEAVGKFKRAELAKTQVRAPWAGRVMQLYVEPGTAVGPASARPVLRLADTSRRRVRAAVEERNVGRVGPGQRAIVTTEGVRFQGKEFSGRVTEVAAIMGQTAPLSDDPEEYKDVYFFEVWIDLEGAEDLPLNHRVRVRIEVRPPEPQG